jgi:hypothetical protein
MLEIGLGCNMRYGPGASVSLWRQWFGDALELHEMEYDRACARRWAHAVPLGVTVHEGDQSNRTDLIALMRNARVTPGPKPYLPGDGQFDLIVDDGGHYADQITTSYHFLFKNALKPGGLYVIEDIAPGRDQTSNQNLKRCALCDGQIIKWTRDLVATMLGNAGQERSSYGGELTHAKQARWVVSADASKCALAVIKADEVQCNQLAAWCPDHG